MGTSARTMGISVTDVDTTQQLPLGFEYHEPASGDDLGEKVWVYVYNDEGATNFTEGTVVMRDAATATYDAVLSTAAVPAIRILGVAQHTIAFGSYGFVLKKGIGEVQANDTAEDQANDPLVTEGTAGRADVMGAGEEHCVFAFSTENAAALAGALMTCWINCPG